MRTPLVDTLTPEIASNFQYIWNESSFQTALAEHDLNEAWTLLSNAAEQAMTNHNGHVSATIPRAAPWKPRRPSEVHKAATVSESFVLRRLRRLCRRLQQLHYTWDAPLVHKVRKDVMFLSYKFPALVRVTLCDLESDILIVQHEIQHLSTLESDTALENWNIRMQQDRSQMAWVKRKADGYLQFESKATAGPTPTADLHRHPIVPEEVIRHAEMEWLPRWTAAQQPASQPADFAAILAYTPTPGEQATRQAAWQSQLEGALTPEQLWKRCRKMIGKAAGPDSWKADQLIHLPWQWWHCLAEPWLKVLRTGNVPDRWREAAVVLLPKDDGGIRPLSLTACVWRIGASVLVQALQSWTTTWADDTIMGGLPGRGVLDAHCQLLEATSHDDGIFVSEDLAKFFDTVDITQACAVLTHLGAPSSFVTLINNFYFTSPRIFLDRGNCSAKWHTATRGLMQGCPCSPLIAAAIMRIWAGYIKQDPQINAMAYIDDRTFWSVHTSQEVNPQVLTTLQAAKARSDHFDTVFGFMCRAPKCAIAARDSPAAQALSATFGYKLSGVLQTLGVQHHIGMPAETAATNLAVRKAELRLKYMALAPIPRHRKWIMIKSLILPILTWCAAFAKHADKLLNHLRTECHKAFVGRVLTDTAFPIKCELMGWENDPKVACLLSSIQFAVRIHVKGAAWLRMVGLTQRKWYHFTPVLTGFMEQHNWWYDATGDQISRRDSHGHIRHWRLGEDRYSIILEWIADIFRANALPKTKRIFGTYKRKRDQGFATGLDALPVHAGTGFCVFAGHVETLESGTNDKYLRHAAFATGCSFWSYTAGQQVQDEDPRALCVFAGNHTPRDLI